MDLAIPDKNERSNCSLCRNLDPSKLTVLEGRHCQEIESVSEWSQIQERSSSWLSCAVIAAVLLRFYQNFNLAGHKIALYYHHNICLRVGETQDEITLYSLFHTPWPGIRISDHARGSTGSPKSLAWAKQQIDKCSRNHNLCQSIRKYKIDDYTSSLNYPPKRLLDIRYLSKIKRTGSVKLIKTGGGFPHRYRYACLSHCWGKTHTLMTTSYNLQDHMSGIKFSALPPMYRDAVVFARGLSIAYLWIDTLCIIQDDPEDWRSHSQAMGSIYHDSAVCLAATISTNDQCSLFSEQPLRLEQIPSSLFGHHGGENGEWEIFARPSIRHDLFLNTAMSGPFGQQTAPAAPLLTRGWVFQERMMAPRFLHFTEQELILECGTSLVCECGCQCGCTQAENSLSKADTMAIIANGDNSQIAILWRQLVSRYSSLSLTYVTDRFPALVGLASMIRGSRGSYCLGGMWEDSALEDLAWEVVNPTGIETDRRIHGKTHPSWSWASIYAPVLYRASIPGTVKPLCESVRIGVEWDMSNVIKPPIMWLNIKRRDRDTSAARAVISGILVPVKVTYEHKGVLCKLEHARLAQPQSFSNDFPFGITGPDQIKSGETLECLLLYQDDVKIVSLVLRSLDNAAGLYERVGLFSPRIEEQKSERTSNIFEGVAGMTSVSII